MQVLFTCVHTCIWPYMVCTHTLLCGHVRLKVLSHCPEIDLWWAHEYQASCDLQEVFWQPKISWRLLKLCWCRRNAIGSHTMAYDALMNGPMFLRCFYDHFRTSGQCETCTTITPEFEHFLIHVSICGQIRDSVRPVVRTVWSIYHPYSDTKQRKSQHSHTSFQLLIHLSTKEAVWNARLKSSYLIGLTSARNQWCRRVADTMRSLRLERVPCSHVTLSVHTFSCVLYDAIETWLVVVSMVALVFSIVTFWMWFLMMLFKTRLFVVHI